jgi:hypothetical protein
MFTYFFFLLLLIRMFAPYWLQRKERCLDDCSTEGNSLEQEFPILGAVRQSLKKGFKHTLFYTYLRLHSIFEKCFYYLVWALILFLLIDVTRNNAVVMNGLGERWNNSNYQDLWFSHYRILRNILRLDLVFFVLPLSIFYVVKKSFVKLCRVIFNFLFLFLFLTFSYAVSSFLVDLLFISMFLYAGIFEVFPLEVARGFYSAIR